MVRANTNKWIKLTAVRGSILFNLDEVPLLSSNLTIRERVLFDFFCDEVVCDAGFSFGAMEWFRKRMFAWCSKIAENADPFFAHFMKILMLFL
jgi:hypothetical protein